MTDRVLSTVRELLKKAAPKAEGEIEYLIIVIHFQLIRAIEKLQHTFSC